MHNYLLDIVFVFFLFIAEFLLVPLFSKLLIKNGLVDKHIGLEGDRKIRERTTVARGAGPIIYFCLVISILFYSPLSNKFTIVLIVSLFLIQLLGFIDDIYRLNSKLKLIIQFGVSAVLVLSGLKITELSNPFGGIFTLPNVLVILVSIAWLIIITNAINLLDGIDGLATSIVIVSTISVWLRTLLVDSSSLSASHIFSNLTVSYLSICFVAISLAFLFSNKFPSKIHLGDSGSYLIGFYLAVLSIASGMKLATIVMSALLPLIDIFWVIAKRIKNSQSIFKADRLHLHLALEDNGYSHNKIVALYLICSISLGVLASFSNTLFKFLLIIIFGTAYSIYILHWQKISQNNKK